ncbi:MAG: hypothetical protein ACI3XG_01725 [Faecousia sp.]
MKNWMVILLAAIVVVAGAFLPEVLLQKGSQPELSMEYQQVVITSQSSSDYTWRMERMAEHYFGEGEQLLSTYISEEAPGEGEGYEQFLTELDKLAELGTIPELALETLKSGTDYRIRYYYLFDSQAVGGFRIAELTAADTNWRIFACMDVESGKLARVDYGGSKLIPGRIAYPETSWYDVLRGYAQYLGLSTTPAAVQEEKPELAASSVRQYYEENTADKWTARMASGDSAWMELRVLRSEYLATVAVYNGGK